MHKKEKKLINIATFEACDSIKKAAEAKNDEEMLHILRSVKDLIAAEAKYHNLFPVMAHTQASRI